MKSWIGYLLAVLGLVVLGLNTKGGKKLVPFLEKVPSSSILAVGLVLIVLGIIVVIVLGKGGKVKQVEKEVPIYKGEGKKRKIVGYKTED